MMLFLQTRNVLSKQSNPHSLPKSTWYGILMSAESLRPSRISKIPLQIWSRQTSILSLISSEKMSE